MEPPGIAPGSETLIAYAFIPIVGPKPDPPNIGRQGYEGKNAGVVRERKLRQFPFRGVWVCAFSRSWRF